MSNAGLVAALALLAALAVAGCGGDEAGDEAARHLDPRSDAVIAVDLDYDGANWEQVKRLYALVIESGAFEGGGPVPPTLEGAFGAAAASAGLSFGDDVKPLPGGTLHAGLPVEPAEPLSPGARDVLERLDDDATRFRRGVPRYVGRVPPGGSGRARARIEKLRGQGLREQPVPGIEDAVYLTDGVGVVGGDTIVVAVGSDGPDDRLLRERLAQEERAQAPESDGAFIPARAAPALLGAVLDRGELVRALATDAGSALRDDFDLQLLRALVARAEASASARDGDIEADAELLWARP